MTENEEKIGEEIPLVDGSDATNTVIVKKKNPFISILVKFVVSILAFFVILFIIGFIMGSAGIRPPSLEWDVVSNQWDKVTGQDSKSTDSELDKKPSPTPSGTEVEENEEG